MNNNRKTKEQLIRELEDLRRRIAELEKSETGRMRPEEALREREIQLQKLFSWVPGMIYQFTKRPDGSYCVPFTTEAIKDIFGCSPQDVCEDFSPIAKVILPEDFDKVVGSIEYSAKHLTIWTCEYQVQIPSQSIRWILGKSTPETLADGSITWHGFNTDITERKQAEEALIDSEERYRSLFENSDDAILMTAPDGRIFQANPSACRMFGRTEAEIIQVGRNGVVDETDPRLPAILEERKRTGKVRGELTYKRGDGQLFPGEGTSVVFPTKDGLRTCMIIRDISERKRVEEALRESGVRLKAQYQGSPIPTFTWQKKGETFELVDFNPAALVATQGETKKYLGKMAAEMYQDRQEILQDIHRCFTEKEVIKKELHSQHFMPGRTMIATYAFVPPDLVMVHTEDVTERKWTEEALKASEEKYRSIIETIEDGYYEVDLAGNLTFFNDAMARINGYSRAEMQGMNDRQYTDAENARILYQTFVRIFHTGESAKAIQYEVITKNGERKSLETSASLIRDPSGNPIGFRGIARDVSELRQVQKALANSEERFRVAAESSNDFIYEWDFQSDRIDWFGKAVERLGDMLGELPVTVVDFDKLIYPEDLERLSEAVRRHSMQGDPFMEEYRMTGKSGDTIHLRSAGMCLRNEEGRAYKWIGTISDITERKKAQKALQSNEERFRIAAESTNDFIYEWDLESGQVDWFGKAVERLGDMLGELPDTNAAFVKKIYSEDLERITQAMIRHLKQGEPHLEEYRLVGKDGNIIHVNSAGMCLREKDGRAYKWIGAISDITERKKAEEELKDSLAMLRKAMGGSSRPWP